MAASRNSRAFSSKAVNLGKMALPPDLSPRDVARIKARQTKAHEQPAPWLRSILARISERLMPGRKA